MAILEFKKAVLCGILLYVTGMSFSSFAAESITITEQAQLDFAQLDKPASGTQTITINPASGGYSGTGTVQLGSPARGRYTILLTGSGASTTCSIDIQNVNSGSSDVTIDQFTGEYDGVSISSFPKMGLSKPDNSVGTTLYLGATAEYTSSVPVGNLIPSFDIVVTLE